MKLIKSILSFGLILVFSVNLSRAQAIDPSTGQPVKYCGQHTVHAELMKNPQYAQQYAIDQELLLQQEELMKNSAPTRGTVYKVPIVFHVLHNGGSENISREQILDGLAVMNRDWRKKNQDTSEVVSEFRNIVADIEVEFVLATKAPNGACFSGITRTQSPLTSVTSSNQGWDQVDAIVAGNDVYNGQWPGNKYLNVFICKNIGGAAGYTTKPSSWSGSAMTNGVWILSNYVGSIGTSSEYTSRTLTHEAGHWLNLSHTWGNTNDPGLASNCDTDDGITDTPNTRGVTSCNLNENFCGPKANVQNYMDYSYCSKMFTEGQKTKIRAALNSSVGGRNNLWTTTNLAATGADGNLVLCEANFNVPKTTICLGEALTFEDISYNNVTSWNWSFQGANVATSNVQNPTVVFNSPGLHTISLTVSDGVITKTVTKNELIRVYTPGSPIPFFDGFEAYTTLENTVKWDVYNPQDNQKFDVTSTAFFGGSKSIKLDNFNQSTGSEDELIAAPLDLSGVTSSTNVALSFRYSYRRKATTNNEKLQVLVSKDCGTTWSIVKNISGTTLGTTVVTSAWTPSANEADWITSHVTNISSTFWVENFLYKFKFTSTGGNNLYLDNINLYPGTASDDPILLDSDNDGLTDDVDNDDDNDGIPDEDDPFPFDPASPLNSLKENTANSIEFSIMPNPADDEFALEYAISNYADTKIEIVDPLGKIIQSHTVKSNPGKNIVYFSSESFSSGIYLVKIKLNNSLSIKRLIIK
jgi:PKD repeat protein